MLWLLALIPVIPFLVFGGFVALLVWGGVMSHRRSVAREAAVAAWAERRGLRFRAGASPPMGDRYPAFACLNVGDRRKTTHLAEGEIDGRTVRCFDHHFRTEREVTETLRDAKGRPRGTRTKTEYTHHRFSAVIAEAGFPLQRLLVRPEGFTDRIASFFGRNDLDFESAAFSRRYHVSADEPKYAYDVLDARTIQRLLDLPDATVEFGGAAVLVFRRGSTLDPKHLGEALATADAVLDGVPSFRRPPHASAPAPDRGTP